MIGILIVSHSAALADAATALAHQMVPDGAVPLRAAAGAGTEPDGSAILGTDAMRVADAIDGLAADGADGVLVLMDLGSAVMSAELALELRASDVPVKLASGPFVEGLLAAMVAASGGADLDAVAHEAASALTPKRAQLGDDGPTANSVATVAEDDDVVRRFTLINPLGLHARPAAMLAGVVNKADAAITLRRLPDGAPVSAASMNGILSIGATGGDQLEFRARGTGADAAMEAIQALVDDGFCEMGAAAQAAAVPAAPVAPAAPDVTPATPPHSDGLVHGRGVSAGTAAAPVVHLGAAIAEPDAAARVADADRDSEADRITPAAQAVAATLRARAASASGDSAAILEAAALMALDPELAGTASASVRARGVTPERAIWEAAGGFADVLATLGDRMAERTTDLLDVRDRIVAELTGQALPGIPEGGDPFVLVAGDLAPADTATLGSSACVALVTERGGPTSHTAIIARALGLPAVVGVSGALELPAEQIVVVDGTAGIVDPRPDADAIARAQQAEQVVAFDGDGRTADGVRIPLRANVGTPGDTVAATAARAEGVGLFRTEFCFLDRSTPPTIAEQHDAYAEVLAAFPGEKVVVRTLDAGADKPLAFANADAEENPALGVRGLRIARRNPALLTDQLTALAQAAATSSAETQVMAPMVATVEETREFAAAVHAAGLGEVGVMIETPAAALMAAELLQVVDFVSLGTNDLTQYTMAADRMLAELSELSDAWQPAVLRLIHQVGEAGAAAGKHVGVCGEAGGDPELAPVLVGLGVTSLSMSARSLGPVAASLARYTLDDCRRAAEAARAAATAADAKDAAGRVLAAARSGD